MNNNTSHTGNSNRSVSANQMAGCLIITGDGNLVIQLSSDQSPEEIAANFELVTVWALRSIETGIPGLSEDLPRQEAEDIEQLLSQGNAVLLTGIAGSGKSNIALASIRIAEGQKPVLFFDARRLLGGGTPDFIDFAAVLLSMIRKLSTDGGCRVVIDQIDNIVGSPELTGVLALAQDCADMESVEILVISRHTPADNAFLYNGEKDVRQDLLKAGFHEVVSQELDATRVQKLFNDLAIPAPSESLIELGRNLLHLRLIAQIKQHQSDFDFSKILTEIDLWDGFIEVIRRAENPAPGANNGLALIEYAERLAQEGLQSSDYSVRYDATNQQYFRLESWRILRRESPHICFFTHDNMQDFLYARGAAINGNMPDTIYEVIGTHRARSVIVWTEKLYARHNPMLLIPFLEEVFRD